MAHDEGLACYGDFCVCCLYASVGIIFLIAMETRPGYGQLDWHSLSWHWLGGIQTAGPSKVPRGLDYLLLGQKGVGRDP